MTNMKYNLKELRQESNLTVKVIIEELNVTKATLYAWENGTTQIPLLQLKALLSLYGANINDLNWDQIFEQLETKRNNE